MRNIAADSKTGPSATGSRTAESNGFVKPRLPRFRAAEPAYSLAQTGDRHIALDEEGFSQCLRRLATSSGLSLTQLARRSWLDISYVSRLVNLAYDPLNPRLADSGEKRQPSRDTVIRLGLALQLPMEQMDELLMTAGYAPLVR